LGFARKDTIAEHNVLFEPAAALWVAFSPYQHLVTRKTNKVRKRAKEWQKEQEAE